MFPSDIIAASFCRQQKRVFLFLYLIKYEIQLIAAERNADPSTCTPSLCNCSI